VPCKKKTMVLALAAILAQGVPGTDAQPMPQPQTQGGIGRSDVLCQAEARQLTRLHRIMVASR